MRVRPRYLKIKTDVNIFFIKKYLTYKLTTHLPPDVLFLFFYLATFGGLGYFGSLSYYGNFRNLFAILFLADGNITLFSRFF